MAVTTNGSCIAPNTCLCAEGWSGSDCSIPTCQQSCSREPFEQPVINSNDIAVYSKGTGNCTHPDTCTCEKGWTGFDCSIPLCAQECNNNGQCVMPDTCKCWRWRSTFLEDRIDGGWPLFRDSFGDSQLTGWTGYDCATPICTQASSFVVNQKSIGSVRLGGYGLILFGHEPYNNIRISSNDGPPYLPYDLTEDDPPEKEFIPELRMFKSRSMAKRGLQHARI